MRKWIDALQGTWSALVLLLLFKKMEASLVKLILLVNFADDLMDERLLSSVLSVSIKKLEASLVKP